MTMRFGSIIIHKAKSQSETDSCNCSSDDAEVAEIAEIAILKYMKQTHSRRSERQRNMSKSRKQISSRRSSSSSLGSNELPILRILCADKSSPLIQSHYSSDSDDILHGKESLTSDFQRHSTKSTEDSDRLGFRVLTSGSRTADNGQRRVALIPDLKSSLTVSCVTNKDDVDSSLRGFSKLFKNLNFTEKLRQQKTEQERLNINKLPDHMREQLKHIYVY